jgi:hypothetical protein
VADVGQVGRNRRQKAELSCVGPLCCLPSYLSLLRLGCATDLDDGTSCHCGCCQRPRHAYGSSSNFQKFQMGWVAATGIGCQDILRAVGTPLGLDFICCWLKVDAMHRGSRAVAAAMCRCRGGAVALAPCSTVALLAFAPTLT